MAVANRVVNWEPQAGGYLRRLQVGDDAWGLRWYYNTGRLSQAPPDLRVSWPPDLPFPAFTFLADDEDDRTRLRHDGPGLPDAIVVELAGGAAGVTRVYEFEEE
jgi:hypothetical protein